MANDVWVLRRIFEKKFGKLEEKESKENYYDPLA